MKIRFLCMLLVIVSATGMMGMFMEEPILPLPMNYSAIFILSLSIAVLGTKGKRNRKQC